MSARIIPTPAAGMVLGGCPTPSRRSGARSKNYPAGNSGATVTTPTSGGQPCHAQPRMVDKAILTRTRSGVYAAEATPGRRLPASGPSSWPLIRKSWQPTGQQTTR